jgi:hypothetical protein
MKTLEFEHEYYPADLQELALQAYEALPESGTVAQLVTRILAELSPHKSENQRHSFVGGESYVQVGWKNDILTEPLGDETREVVNVGTMQWFDEVRRSVTVCPDGRYISRTHGSSSYQEITDEQAQDHRELRWELVK